MPIYEYECKACGHRLEKLQKISAEPLTDCPVCEASALSRLVSAAGFRLAGSGWYETDFKSGGKKNLVGDTASADGGGKTQSDSQSAGAGKTEGGNQSGDTKKAASSENKASA